MYNEAVKTALVRINALLTSRRFFQATVAFFIFEAVWFVLSAGYPMAFDEDFHFGLIRVYAHYWLPFLNTQPPNAAAFGAVARDASYLYHYLMSFPYRFLALFIHSQTGLVIALRLISVALFSTGLVLFRRVLLRARLSVPLTNITLLLFVLIPIVPQLAAQINYDNLLFPLVAWVCLLSFRLIDELRAKRPTARTSLTLLAVCLFTSLVKYAFLPIFVGVAVFLAVSAYRVSRQYGRQVVNSWWLSLRRLPWPLATLLIALCVLGAGMLWQRDGLNVVRYHAISPDCGQVLSVKTCSAYPPWYFSYTSHQQAIASTHTAGAGRYQNPIVYLGVWLYWMWFRLFFAVNGPASGFVNYPPLPLPSAAAALLIICGVVMVVTYRRRIFRGNTYMLLLLVISLCYITALLADGYTAYHYTDVLQTMNGRYLLPVLLLLAAIVGKAFSIKLDRTPIHKTVLAATVLLFFMQGGGVLTFITRSDSTWNWPNSTVVRVNNAARTLTKPFVIKGSKSYSTPVWMFN